MIRIVLVLAVCGVIIWWGVKEARSRWLPAASQVQTSVDAQAPAPPPEIAAQLEELALLKEMELRKSRPLNNEGIDSAKERRQIGSIKTKHHRDWEKIASSLGSDVRLLPMGDFVVIDAPVDRYGEALALVRSLDVKREVLRFDVIILIVRLNAAEQFSWELLLQRGLDGGAVEITPFGVQVEVAQLVGAIAHLQDTGRSWLVSRPSIFVQDGGEGSISSGRKVPIATTSTVNTATTTDVQFVDVLLSLTVRPFIEEGGRVRIDVEQVNDDIAGFQETSGGRVPEIATQTLTSSIVADLGAWALLGGVKVEQEAETRSRLLGLLPVVKSDQGTRLEVGILLRAQLASEDASGEVLERLETSAGLPSGAVKLPLFKRGGLGAPGRARP